MTTFWQELETKKLTKPKIEKYLTQKLGEPQTELQQNLLFELTKKINSYYSEEPQQSSTAYFLSGQVQEIVEKRFKEGKRKGQIFYSLRLSEPKGEKLRALKEDLPTDKWEQIDDSKANDGKKNINLGDEIKSTDRLLGKKSDYETEKYETKYLQEVPPKEYCRIM